MVLISDSLGLYVSPNCVLAGHGNQAVLYSSNKKVKLPTGLRKGKVHGFALSPVNHLQDLVLIFSENEYSIILHSRSKANDQFQLVFEGETKDWINAAKFLLGDNAKDKKTFVLHLAHSALLYLEFDLTSHADCRPLELARCSESSILYCTRLHGERFQDLAIISGNAFGELLVWQTQSPIDAKAGAFVKTYPLLLRLQAHNGVIFSIDFHMTSQLLVTTSDDRSVKFWQIQKVEGWQTAKIKPLFSCFGHSSRVMCAVIFEAGGQAYVASGGEDSYVCVWSLCGDLLLKRRQHSGLPIWRLGFREEDYTLYSTSSSGNLAAESLEELFGGHKSAAHMLSHIDGAATDEFIRSVKFLGDQLIVGLTSLNRLYYMRVSQDKWQQVDRDFPTYERTVLEVSGHIIATCGQRRMTIYRHNARDNAFDRVFDGETGLTGTIRSFHFLSKDLYLASDDLGNCQSLKAHDLSLDSPVELGKYREAWLTAALLISERYLLLGDRRGHVMLYCRCSHQNTFSLKATLKHLHGKMGTNFFKLLRADEATAYVLSGGHEPLLKYLHLGLAECTLAVGQRESVPLSWVEASPRRDVVLGFNDDHIVAWSRRYDVLAQLACGGGHRCWDYRLADDDGLAILFVKRKRVFLYRQPLYHRIARDMAKLELNSWHTRNCNSARLLAHGEESQPLIVSAGDDNVIKVTKVVADTLLHCAEVHSHVSTVRCLQALRLASSRNSTTWLIFSVGGRSLLCINQLTVNAGDNQCLVTELCTQALQKSSSVEARLMAIDVAQEEAAAYFSLYVAVADGEIRHYRWHLDTPSEPLLQSAVDIEGCPLTLQWIKSRGIVLITTTGGEVYGFDRTLTTKYLQLRLHVTGINTIDTCLDARQPQRLHILSGGDDENIKYTVLDLDSMTVAYKREFLDLHNAQVNALSIHCSEGESEAESAMFAFTCGIDKQIFRIDLRTHEHKRVGHSSIADIKGMLIDKQRRQMYFYGSGFEIVEL
ncbi:tRNA (34-2'-O)-methyltransferase regulator WDR6 [Drosophila kikkawai]|uniref:tRNA (34-2'-O)-methyltransferase regulator WDR6 n=1 Tax=Drosophila kikkawai TaxID=30033 RepID=A0A6P4J571_DROKI|nr:WD repeat-containing protein 6 [Drosophila kikkawai]